jgi:hypothetical protein
MNMGYFNRHFNKQLNRKGFRIVKGTRYETLYDKDGKPFQAVDHHFKGVFRIGERQPLTAKDYKFALSGRM